MIFIKHKRYVKILTFFGTAVLIIGCGDLGLMHPKGQIGMEERSLILVTLGLMMIVVAPVIGMAFTFTIKYRALNKRAQYSPNWAYSKPIELIVWTVPILIITILAVLTWKSSHALDPRKPIKANVKPVEIQAIAMDWKWLFIYPEQNVAAVNEVVFPSNVPIKFSVTSNSVMNSFFISQLGTQIYAMAGMNSTLYLIANQPGEYKGISSHFSGRGFSGMKFTAIATLNREAFDKWIQKVRASKNTLNTMNNYDKLAAPTEYHPVEYFSRVRSGLYQEIIKKFVNNEGFPSIRHDSR